MKICMIGAGYVGLVSGACFADLGNFVWCVDKDNQKINMLNNNETPIYEPGLKDLIDKNYNSGRLKFTTNLKMAIKKGGSSIRDFKNISGKKGTFQKDFNVYQRENLNCLKAKCKGTIQKKIISNRSSFFCNYCQK